MELYLKKYEENGYDRMTNINRFTNEALSIRQDKQAVDDIKLCAKKLTLNEKGRG